MYQRMRKFVRKDGKRILISRSAIRRIWETDEPGVCQVEYMNWNADIDKIEWLPVICPFDMINTEHMLVVTDAETHLRVAICRTDILTVEEIDRNTCDITYSPFDESTDVCNLVVAGNIDKLMKDFEEE